MSQVTTRELTIRAFLLVEVQRFIERACTCPGVRRIALIGSLTTDKENPKDADVLVTVDDDADLTQLATLGRRLKGHAQSRNKSADIFLADPLGRYIGRICSWRECYPGKRMSCDARHCGRRAFLHDDLDDVTLHEALIQTPPLEIWPKIVRRIELPADVESQLIQPIDTGRANSRWDAHRRLRLIGKTVGNDEPPQAAGIGSRWGFLGISAERLYRRSNCGFAWISAKGMRGMTDFGLAAN